MKFFAPLLLAVAATFAVTTDAASMRGLLELPNIADPIKIGQDILGEVNAAVPSEQRFDSKTLQNLALGIIKAPGGIAAADGVTKIAITKLQEVVSKRFPGIPIEKALQTLIDLLPKA
ncbi:hypothetical protein Poli38472_014392 [Pythium oligandrum]|uniref:Uncharacterized protein n=1 Tax=Pythium oligandrum TaxID=41045 RepID=A0A8K1C710_PYTOL|nr:hypothetical protein Poli38472_014392 [Pythium oligandrum]|eukprot:TMW57789.1 hypothetical protein Poli38472_014392 [Pythium oligandrum]